MRLWCFALLAVLAGPIGAAQEGGRLSSPDCRRAMDALQVQEARASEASQADRRDALKQVEASRRDAARTCLGGTGDPPPLTSRFVQPPPIAAPPAAAHPAPPPRPTPVVPMVSPPLQRQPTVVMACDAAGCWTSDGSRLVRQGPFLAGPRGLCTGQGVMVHCP